MTNLLTNKHDFTLELHKLHNMTWDGIVTKAHKYYLKELGIPPNIEAYMQSNYKTLESTFIARRK